MTVVCAYAATAMFPPNIKQTFYSELQDTIDKILRTDVLVILGGFNARVGKEVIYGRRTQEGIW